MPSYISKGEQLAALARRLGAAELPYYLANPRGPAEPAPGWYWRPADAEHPVYLAASFLPAYTRLANLREGRRVA